MQETRVNTSSEEVLRLERANETYSFYFSSKPDTAQHRPAAAAGVPKAKAKSNNNKQEYHGVGFVIGPKLRAFVKDCIPHNSRIVELSLHSQGPDICVLNQYAPHSGRPTDEKHHHWEQLQEIVANKPRQTPTYIWGDCNARLHGRVSVEEERVVGAHVFGVGPAHVQEMPEDQRENRQCLIDFCLENDYVVSNTFFAKHEAKKCTYKDPNTSGFTAPWTPYRFGQLDFLLAPTEYTNSVLDVTSRTDIAFNSDHALVQAKICIKLKSMTKLAHSQVERYHEPTQHQIAQYNAHLRRIFVFDHAIENVLQNCSRLSEDMKSAARHCFCKKSKEQNQSYISQQTWNLIEQRHVSRNRGQGDEEKRLNVEIARSARKDKQRWRLQKLQDLSDKKKAWQSIRFENKAFTPSFYSMKDIHGRRVPLGKKADALAEYLYEKQWAPIHNPSPIDASKRRIVHENLDMDIDDFTEAEVQAAINVLKTNKAPGPDGCITELFKFLDEENVRSLTKSLNALWNAKEVPQEFTRAQVASLYKKGDHDNPENYRPISLLNTSCKIFAYILKVRIAVALDNKIGETQSGFRKGRSTIDPLFCVRRLVDVVEQGYEPLVMIFLDWEKAFDKIDHQKMFASLERLNIPNAMLAAIKALYNKPEFQVSHKHQNSSWMSQRTGIRQGCPLSPYLFILTMHCMFHDVKEAFNDPLNEKTFQGINFHELLYADDTLIVAKSFRTANKYLRLVENESHYLHLKLNQSKCSFIAFNCQGQLRFQNGEPMTCSNDVTYLGMSVTQRVDPKHEIRKRISSTMAVLKKLDIFWLKAQCSKKWKLTVYNAIITSKVLYGLETLEPTQATAKLLNTFQLKGLRKILKLHTTFVQRHNTNEYVYRRANEELGAPAFGRDRKIKPLTEILEDKKIKMLGHILRRERRHPLHQATFATPSALPRETEHRRVGRPRQFWTVNVMQKAWKIIKENDPTLPNLEFDKHNRYIRERIIDQAHNYQVPFN